MGFGALDPERGLDRFAAGFIRRMARRLVGQVGFTSSDREDIEQELALELVARFPKYDPSRAKRTTFTAAVLKNRAANLVRDRRALRRNRGHGPQSLSGQARGQDGRSVQRADLLGDGAKFSTTRHSPLSPEELAQLRFDLRQVLPRLPVPLREICEALLEGLSTAKAAKRLGISRATAARRMHQILRIFRDQGLDGYFVNLEHKHGWAV